ncbi:Riboflavin transporter [Roseovarius sp. THAF9]|uniref:DMT family transporter n=1 Tax=Roseovarius sp. THAF9 TaxID=2587847 RepID=UPI001268B16C|nr:DMT family transporter [Roseovarius sp. THAF9]QFT93113.1 Riboflavin transporter [Roseovarius sp. THAF9]
MDNLRGIVLVILSMAAFTVEDMFIKKMSADISVGQILIFLGIGSASIFAVVSRLGGHRIFAKEAWRRPFLLRAGCEAGAALAFTTALSLVDISVVASVFQATPLFITMGAALFLGEDVGWRRWSAILIGFCGVLLIIRPGLAGFDPSALLVLVSVACVAARDLITRRIDVAVSSAVVSFQGFAAVVPAGILLILLGPQTLSPLTPQLWAMIGGGMVFGALGYYGIVAAMRMGDAAVVTPFRYTRLLFSLIVGVVVFAERPDSLTLLGATLIITTGLYTYLRERRVARCVRPA